MEQEKIPANLPNPNSHLHHFSHSSPMAPLPFHLLFLLLFPLAATQSNIQTFFPSIPTPALINPPPPSPSPTPPPTPPPTPTPIPSPSSTKRSDITVAVVATALSSFVLYSVLFAVFLRCAAARKKDVRPADDSNSNPLEAAKRTERPPRRGYHGSMVDENGLDAIYWKEFEKESSRGKRCEHCEKAASGRPQLAPRPPRASKRAERRAEDEEREERPPRGRHSIDQEPFLPRGSIDSASGFLGDSLGTPSRNSSSSFSVSSVPRPPPPQEAAKASPPLPLPPGRSSSPSPSPPPAIAASPPLPPPPGRSSSPAPACPPPPKPEAAPPPPPPPQKSAAAPPPPPRGPPPPPPPAAPRAPPPPPPPGGKKSAAGAPPPPPPRAGGASSSSSRPPAAPPTAVGAAGQQPKLKPLHWDKVNVGSTDHSMVWDKITGGSFNLDEGIIEALFGTVATNRKSKTANQNDPSSGSSSANAPAGEKICLLESRKSQNISIILRSLAVSMHDILDALLDGSADLSTDTLEKLSHLGVSKQEETTILKFSGDTAKLAHAESFLFRLLCDVPTPFARISALLFKANYASEVRHLKRSLQTLELACQELRTKGLFFKLLEAVLKAGNRMNAGTARGNAQAFNLTALRKLSDIKSTDGSTSLLHFVVEEVVRAEGKRLAVNHNYSLRRSGSLAKSVNERGSSMAGSSGQVPTRQERQNEYMNLGLPIVGGLSTEFANVKKAAIVDYDAVVGECAMLGTRLSEIKKLLETCGDDGFARAMQGFVKAADQELKELRAEQERVIELVQRTTEFYHAGATKDKSAHPLQLFIIVRDFLGMVDQACVDIKRKLQQKKPPPSATAAKGAADGAPQQALAAEGPDSRRKRVMPRFPNLPAHFMKENAESDSSSDEE